MIGILIAGTAFGVPQSIIYYVGKNKIEFKEIVPVLFAICLVFCILFLIIIITFSEKVLSIFAGINEPLFLMLILAIYLVKLADYFLIGYIRALKNFTFYNIRRISESFVFILLVLLYVTFSEPDVSEFLFIYLSISVVSLVFMIFFIYFKLVEDNGKYKLKQKIFKKLISFGLKSYLQNLTGFLNYQISIIFLTILLNNWAVGIYSAGVSLAAISLFIPDTIGTVLLPHLSSKQDDSDIHQVTAAIIRNTLLILISVLCIFTLIGKILIQYLYGVVYLSAYYPMIIMLPGMVFLSMYKILTRNFTSRNKQHYTIIVSLIILLINFVLNYFLIKQWGIYGAAISSSFSFTSLGILLLIIFQKESRLSFMDILIINKADFDLYRKLISRRNAESQKSILK